MLKIFVLILFSFFTNLNIPILLAEKNEVDISVNFYKFIGYFSFSKKNKAKKRYNRKQRFNDDFFLSKKAEKQKKIFDDVTVINSDEENTREGWIDLGDEAYFTAQFRKALELFKDNKKVLMHCQGDTVFGNYDQLVKDARKYYNLYEWGVYAPDVTNVWYTPDQTDINGIESEDDNIKMVACTDETVWFVHRDIINEYYERKLD